MKRFLAIALAVAGVAFAGNALAASYVLTGTATVKEGTFFITSAQLGDVNAYTAGMAANGVQASRHNLGSMGNFITAAPTLGGTSTSEICVFCHTPHHTVQGVQAGLTGSSGDYSPAPLWNRRTAATNFIGYGTTIGGTTAGPVGGVTLACLSCHDGVTTFDNLVNAPGEGGLAANYGDAASAGWKFMDEGSTPAADTTLVGGAADVRNISPEDRLNIGKGPAGGTNVDLSNDHPMSITYNGGTRASLRATTTVISDINLAAGLASTTIAMIENLNQNRWAVKGFISTTATIADLLRVGKVECSSCHDPHFKNLSNADLVMGGYLGNTAYFAASGIQKQDGLFLRRVGGNAGSGVCRTCHNK